MPDTPYSIDALFDPTSPYFSGAPQLASAPSFAPTFDSSADAVLQGANAQYIGIGGTTATVPLGGDIQGAIDKVYAAGGGTVYLVQGTYIMTKDIIVKQGVSIKGAGRTETAIVFGNAAFGIKAIGVSSDFISSFKLSDFAMGHSTATAGIDLDFCIYFELENLVIGTSGIGIRIQHSPFWRVDRVISGGNTSHGIQVVSDSTQASYIWQISNSDFELNGGNGVSITQSAAVGIVGSVIECISSQNTVDGFDLNGGGQAVINFIGNQSSSNVIGFDIDFDYAVFSGNVSASNSSDGFQVSGDNCKFIGNLSDTDSGTAYNNSGVGNKSIVNSWSTETVTRIVSIKAISEGTALSIGDGLAYFVIPSELNGMNLTNVGAHVYTVSSSGTPTVQINNVTQGADMLSTKITIDANEKDSSTAATPAVIDTSNDDVATGDEIRIDVDVAGTATTGLDVRLTFSLP